MGWYDLLHMKELCYPQLTLEFLSSFHYSESTGHWTFRIANIGHKLSDEQVSDMFGWSQDIDCVPNCFESKFLRELTQHPKISYAAKLATSSQTVKHSDCYIHKVLNHTLYGRGDSVGGVSREVLKVIYGMHHNIKLDFTSILAKRLTDIVKWTHGSIVIGGFITRIAEKLGAFDSQKTKLVAVEGRTLVDEITCLNMGLIERVKGEVQLKPHLQDQIEVPPLTNEAGTSAATMLVPWDGSGDAFTSTPLEWIERQLRDLHFKVDAYFSHVGFTPPSHP